MKYFLLEAVRLLEGQLCVSDALDFVGDQIDPAVHKVPHGGPDGLRPGGEVINSDEEIEGPDETFRKPNRHFVGLVFQESPLLDRSYRPIMYPSSTSDEGPPIYNLVRDVVKA